jgi:hypothetical protein
LPTTPTLYEQSKSEKLSGELLLDLELLSLSDTKGLVDIYWGIPGGLTAGKPKRAIATPLDLVDGIKIINNTNKQLFSIKFLMRIVNC